jgi:prenyltransferase beta subunit
MSLRPALIAVAVACFVFNPLANVRAADAPNPVMDAGARAANWLATKQEADGGYGSGFSKGSDLGATADAVVALAAAKKPLSTVKSKTGKTPLDYLEAQVRSGKLNAGQYTKIALAVEAAGLNPAQFGGKDLLAQIKAGYNEKTGVIGANVFIHSSALLALATAKATLPAKAVSALEGLQSPTGGWAFMGSGDPDVDTTALAVQALIAAGRPANSGAAGKGLGYLHSLQNTDGGFPYQSPSAYGTETNANSTGLAAQAIIASGDQPESWAASKGNPLSALITLQQPSGALSYQGSMPGDNVMATIGAIQALYRVNAAGK